MKEFKSRVGMQRKAKNGMNMTILAYRSSKDIDILFEDSVVVRGQSYSDFTRGNISYPASNHEVLVKEMKTLRNGDVRGYLI